MVGIVDPLARTDYVAYWAREAQGHAASFAWAPDRIPTVVATLETVFGAEWLREAAKEPSRTPLTGDPHRHPVAVCVARPDRSSVFELIELAVYLRSCARLPGFGDLTKLLRVPQQFATARMQLALAHRLCLAGAVEVALEPVADRGRKADLYFHYGERGHLVECYEPAAERNANHDELLNAGAVRVLDAAKKSGRFVVVRIDLHCDLESFDGKLRKRVEQEARYLISKLTGPQTRVVKTLNDFEVEVVEASGVDPIRVKELAFDLGQPGAWIISPGTMHRNDVARVQRGEAPSIPHSGWFVVNAKPQDDVAAMFRLAKAIEGKIAQVRRRAENVLGLMVAITDFAPMAAKFAVSTRPLVEALRTKVLGAHAALAGVMLLGHALHKENGPFIGGLFVEGREGAHLAQLHATIAYREETRRVIDDWA